MFGGFLAVLAAGGSEVSPNLVSTCVNGACQSLRSYCNATVSRSVPVREWMVSLYEVDIFVEALVKIET
jgi:hypothetical protein